MKISRKIKLYKSKMLGLFVVLLMIDATVLVVSVGSSPPDDQPIPILPGFRKTELVSISYDEQESGKNPGEHRPHMYKLLHPITCRC